MSPVLMSRRSERLLTTGFIIRLNYPQNLNFLRTGRYEASKGSIMTQTTYGFLWESNIGQDLFGQDLVSRVGGVITGSYSSGAGLAIRCVVRAE